MKIKLLLISFYYPPVISIASYRIESFCKYLDQSLFDIDLITIKNKDLSREERDNLTIHRVSKNPFDSYLKIDKNSNFFTRKLKALYNIVYKYFLFRDFKKKGLKKAFELCKGEKYNIVLSSSAPEITHEIALEIKKYYKDIKWIADMRDEMSLNPFISPKIQRKLAKLEKKIFKKCDAVTSVSKPILTDFIKLSGNNNTIVFQEIRNGYDFIFNEEYSQNDIFTISHIGSFYGIITPKNFLKALDKLVCENKIDKIKIQFIGKSGIVQIPNSLKDNVEVYSLVKHSKALEFMKKSDVLLLIHPNSGRKGVYTGKLFEYLGMNKPIFALVDTKDVASELIKKANAGYSVEENDIESIKETFLKIYKEWQDNKRIMSNMNIIKKHHRKEQVKRLQKLIMELI